MNFAPCDLMLWGMMLSMSEMLPDDQRYIQDLYFKHRELIYYIAWKYFKGDQAEIDDAILTVTEKMCRNVQKIRAVPCNKTRAYIVSMIENVCRDRLEKLLRERQRYVFLGDDADLLPAEDNVEETVFRRSRTSALMELLDRLPPRDREILRMRHMGGMGYSQIAETLNMTESAVRTAAFRSQKRLKEMAKEWEEDEP